MEFTKPITQLIHERFSCRTYAERPIESKTLEALIDFSNNCQVGPFGSRSRFKIVAASEEDLDALSGLGTYGFISKAPGFIIGAAKEGGNSLEDFGYLMETVILYATNLGLGTCWLGGTFTRSKFAEKIALAENEIIPAVTAVGYVGSKPRGFDQRIRKAANSDQRLPWDKLFFKVEGDAALPIEDSGIYQEPLEMLRLGPSASNKQPWRVVKGDNAWHFYLLRTSGYRDNPYIPTMKIADLQRIDMGIAMSHFELTAKEKRIKGSWEVVKPETEPPNDAMEYLVSWIDGSGP